MNHFFYETRGKEKVEELMKEGMSSQAYHRSDAPTPDLRRALPKLLLGMLGILGLLELLIR
jgi:hypothetical protein